MFTKAQDGSDITTLEMCKAQDYLICLTTIKTGTRPGALQSVTLQHYNTMKRDDETGKPVLLVPDHKRGVAGPALIGLDNELKEFFKIYVQKIRPKNQTKQTKFHKDTIIKMLVLIASLRCHSRSQAIKINFFTNF